MVVTPGRGVRAGERVKVTTRGDSYQEVKQFLILFRAMLCCYVGKQRQSQDDLRFVFQIQKKAVQEQLISY